MFFIFFVEKVFWWCTVANEPLFGHPVALASFGELLQLSCVHVAHPFPAFLGRRADPRVADNLILTQSLHVRPMSLAPSGRRRLFL
jgi:hypothetical protein